MRDYQFHDHTIRVNKVATGFLWVGTMAMLLFFLFTGLKRFIYIYIAITTLIGALISTILIKTKKFSSAIPYILFISVLTDSFFAINSKSTMIEIFIMGLCMAALYLQPKIFITCSCIFNISFIAVQLFFRISPDILSFTTSLVSIDLCAFILYFVTKWGSELIKSASEKVQNNDKLLSEMEKDNNIIKDNTLKLNKDIVECDSSLHTAKEMSNDMTSTINEVAKGTSGQANSINQISAMMNDADQKVSQVYTSSQNISQISAGTNQVVSEGSKNISQMGKQMEVISNAVTKSLTTVNELQANMDEINSFLTGITQIAEQTNLLALNAAIEAARAGDAGRGFAVVADEIRKLADQSAEIANKINSIISKIKEKTSAALVDAESGDSAVQQGAMLVDNVNNNFEKISKSFSEMDSHIENELKMIENTTSIFSKINKEAENIAAISEEHSATTEEMLAAVEEYNANIDSIYESMQEIKKSSENLQLLTQRE